MEKKLVASGLNTVMNLINSKFFSVKSIILREEYKQKTKLLETIKKKSIQCIFFDKKKFDKCNFGKRNQGIVAVINNYEYVNLLNLIKDSEYKKNKKFSLFVMLDCVEDPHNFGAIIRTCAAFSVDGIIIKKKNQVPVNSTVIKVSVGGISHIPICQINNIENTIKELRRKNFKIISTVCEKEENIINLENLKIDSNICLILGNENKGISKTNIKNSDFKIKIPIEEKNMPSLNVSVACGIILYKISEFF